MRDAAATIPMSDRGLKKVCQRYHVPVPPLGYWNKLQAGHQVEQLPLSAPVSDKLNDVVMLEPGVEVIERNRAARDALITPTERAEHQRQKAAARTARFEARLSSIRSSAKPRILPSRPARFRREARYVTPIERWDWTYSFGINEMPNLIPGAYADDRSLTVYGTLTRPFRISGSLVQLTFMGSALVDNGRNLTGKIGTLRKEDDRHQYYAFVSLPRDVLSTLIQMLLAERLRYVVLGGTGIANGQADIRRFNFAANVPLADLQRDRPSSASK